MFAKLFCVLICLYIILIMIVKKTKQDREKKIKNTLLNSYSDYSDSYSYEESTTCEQFNSYFAQLQSSENWLNSKIISKIYKYAKKEEILISREQFELLFNIAISIRNFKQAKEIIEIIDYYSSLKTKNWFKSVMPSNFIEQISIFLPHNTIFNIYRNCLLDDPANTLLKLNQLNITEIILKNLKKYESLRLYAELLNNDSMNPFLEQFLPQVVSETIQNYNKKRYIEFLKGLKKIINNKNPSKFMAYVQLTIQDQNFFSIFLHKHYRHYDRIKILKFINSLCAPDKTVALLFAKSQIWSFVNDSFNVNNSLSVKEKKKMQLNNEFFNFIYNIGETINGKIFLFQNNVHMILFDMIRSNQFHVVNESIKVICQIGLLDNIDVAIQLVQNGLIDILTETITTLDISGQRSAIDCISKIEELGETNNNDNLVNAIYDNSDLMDAIEVLNESDDQLIYDMSKAFLLRYAQWIQDN